MRESYDKTAIHHINAGACFAGYTLLSRCKTRSKAASIGGEVKVYALNLLVVLINSAKACTDHLSMIVQVLPKLKNKIPIERARMRLKLEVPASSSQTSAQRLIEFIEGQGAVIESRESHAQVPIPFKSKAGNLPFKTSSPKGDGKVQILKFRLAFVDAGGYCLPSRSALLPRYPLLCSGDF